MKKVILVALLLATYSYGKIITIIDNGVERKISLPTKSVGAQARIVQSKSNGIIIAFKKGVNVDIAAFASSYGLQLKKRLSIGYYIFQNQSAQSDLELIGTIAKERRDTIKTIRPNWGFNNKPL